MSTIKDVAALAGVSIPTAYKAFNSNYYTSPEIKERVLEAAKQLNYVHKVSVKNVSGNDSKLIALIVTQVINPFNSFFIKELQKELGHYGHKLIVLYSNEDEQQEIEDMKSLLEHKVDAIIFTPVTDESKDYIQSLAAGRFPLLQLFRPVYDDLDTILIDDELGTYLAVQNLIQSGHKRIMMISKTNPNIIKRELGYVRAFEEANLPVDNDCIYLMPYIDSVKEMVKDKINQIKPTAILSIGESVSVCVVQSLNEMNLAIPNDVSLIVYDDLPWVSTYGITAVSHSYESLGRLAAEVINSRINETVSGNYNSPVTLMLDPRLVSRNSVKIIIE